VRAHLRETEEQLNRLEQCLSSMGESTSTLKDTAQSVMANIMVLGHSMA
jgi:ferritin-like metal-binding protein YciE